MIFSVARTGGSQRSFYIARDFHSTYPHYVHEGEYINIASVLGETLWLCDDR